MESLLSERPLLGYPNVRVQLHVYPKGDACVLVEDSAGTFALYTGDDRKRAKDAYFHPFVNGYEYNIALREDV